MAEEYYNNIFGNSGDDFRRDIKVLEDMMINDKNIAMKTEMKTPFEFSVLESYTEYLRSKYWKIEEKKKFFKLISVLDTFISAYRPNMVSFNRKSRDETTKVLTARLEDKNTARSTFDKLMGRNKDK